MFRNETVEITTTSVVCDTCEKEMVLGKNLGWDARMNLCLAAGFTFKEENGVFKNYCKCCVSKLSDLSAEKGADHVHNPRT